jgi:hypothetical protein
MAVTPHSALLIGGLAIASQAYVRAECRHCADIVLYTGDDSSAREVAMSLARLKEWSLYPSRSPTQTLRHRSAVTIRIYGRRLSGAANYCPYGELASRAAVIKIDDISCLSPGVTDALALTAARGRARLAVSLIWVGDVVFLRRKLDGGASKSAFDGLPIGLSADVAWANAVADSIAAPSPITMS